MKMMTPRFATEHDKERFEYAQGRIADGHDLDFYLQKENDGFVLMPGGEVKKVNTKR